MYREGARYASEVLRNSRRLGVALTAHGIPVIASERGFTDNHMIFLDARSFGSGIIVLEKLLRANISANRLIPFGHMDAIRIGVQEITRRGYGESDLETIAGWSDRILNHNEPPEQIRPEVIGLVRAHTAIQYTGLPGLERDSLVSITEPPVASDPSGRSKEAKPVRDQAKPRWAQIQLSPATESVDTRKMDEVRSLGRPAGAFEHQTDSAGNISVTDEQGRLFVTASGAYIKDLRDDDMVWVNGFKDWTLRCAGDGPPSTEAYMHYLIRRETGARYIVHNHYIADGRLEGLRVSVIPPKEYGSVGLAEAAAEAAVDHPVFYVRRHGLVFWAKDFEECMARLLQVAEDMTLLG